MDKLSSSVVEDGWIGVGQLQIDNMCIGVRQLRI